jgi:hypothetical protein
MPEGGVKTFSRPVFPSEVEFCNSADEEGVVYVFQTITLHHNAQVNTDKLLVVPNFLVFERLVLKTNECARARVGSIVLRVRDDGDELRIIECGIVWPGFRNFKRLKCPSDGEVLGIIRKMGDDWGVVSPYLTAVASALLYRLDAGLDVKFGSGVSDRLRGLILPRD